MAGEVKRGAASEGYATLVGQSKEWRAVMADSRMSLCPRGFGRTSYHLVETLQMGLVPIHVHSDTPWVPYARLFERVGFVTSFQGLASTLRTVARLPAERLAEMEANVTRMLPTHFTMDGVMGQIRRFMLHGEAGEGEGEGSDLECRALPKTIRDDFVWSAHDGKKRRVCEGEGRGPGSAAAGRGGADVAGGGRRRRGKNSAG